MGAYRPRFRTIAALAIRLTPQLAKKKSSRQVPGKAEDETSASTICPTCKAGELEQNADGAWQCPECGADFAKRPDSS